MPRHGLLELIFPGTGCQGKKCIEPIDFEIIAVCLPHRGAWPGLPVLPKLFIPWSALIGKVMTGAVGITSGRTETSSIFHIIQCTNPFPPGASGSFINRARNFEIELSIIWIPGGGGVFLTITGNRSSGTKG
jgi:hypothetical protein